MRRILTRHWIVLAAALAVASGLAMAQAPQQNSSGQEQQKPAKPSEKASTKKSPIAGAARVSTEAALEDAAQQAAKKPAPTADSQNGPATEQGKENPAGDSVVELHPAESDSAPSTSVKAESPKGKKGKDIHGTVYGATDATKAGTHRAGGAVGATSKSGKTSVYVQTESSRATPPR